MRFRNRGFRNRTAKPQTIWSRPAAAVTALGTAGPVQVGGGAIFSGAAVDAGLDQRLTLLRTKLWLIPGTAPGYVATSTDLAIRWEMVLVGNGEPLPASLGFLTAGQRQRDIIAYGLIPIGPASFSGATQAPILSANRNWMFYDIKAKRKSDADENISVNAETFRLNGGAVNANDQLQLYIQASVLFERTMHRR